MIILGLDMERGEIFSSVLRFLFSCSISFDEDSFLVWRDKKDKRTEIKYVTIRFG